MGNNSNNSKLEYDDIAPSALWFPESHYAARPGFM